MNADSKIDPACGQGIIAQMTTRQGNVMKKPSQLTRGEFIQALLGSTACCVLGGCSQKPGDSKSGMDDSHPLLEPEESPIGFGTLAEIPEMSLEVLSAENEYFVVPGNKLARDKESGIVAFNLQVPAKHTVSKKMIDLSFYGDTETMLNLVNEIKYLHSQRGAFRVDEVALGVYDGAEDLVTSLWQIVRHPIKSGKGIVVGAKAAYDYFWRAWDGEPLPTLADVKAFATDFYEDQLIELALKNKFELGLSQIPETREVLGRQVNSLLTGQALFEVMTLLVAWLKLAKATKVGKATKAVPSKGKFFKNLSRVAKFQKKVKANQAKVAAVFQKVAQKTAKHIDPRDLAVMKGNRPENIKLYRILFQLYHAKQYGGKTSNVIGDGLESVNATSKIPSILHSPKLAQKQIQQAFDDAQRWGVFSDPENLSRLAKGSAPYIRKGKSTGQQVNVDHIVPLSKEPRLGKNLGNLRLLPASDNIRRSNQFDGPAKKHLDLFQREFPSIKTAKLGAFIDKLDSQIPSAAVKARV